LNDYLTEQEQVELLKRWIKQYSLVILLGVVLAIAIISGWRYWQARHDQYLIDASNHYDQMLINGAQGNVDAASREINILLHDYSTTVYAQMAALMQAHDAVATNDYQTAENSLTWVLHHSHIASFRQIARIRLARVLIDDKKPAQAVAILRKVDDKTFAGMISEVLGDAYFAMQNYPAARNAYGNALQSLPNAEVVRPILQMKYDNLTS